MQVHDLDDLHAEVASLRSDVADLLSEVERGNETRESVAESIANLSRQLTSLSEFTEGIADGMRMAAAETRRAEWFLAIRELGVLYIGFAGCLWATDILFGVNLNGVVAKAVGAGVTLLFSLLSH